MVHLGFSFWGVEGKGNAVSRGGVIKKVIMNKAHLPIRYKMEDHLICADLKFVEKKRNDLPDFRQAQGQIALRIRQGDLNRQLRSDRGLWQASDLCAFAILPLA